MLALRAQEFELFRSLVLKVLPIHRLKVLRLRIVRYQISWLKIPCKMDNNTPKNHDITIPSGSSV